MCTGGRLFVLYQQLQAKNLKLCTRCSLPYDPAQANRPHCTGLTERQVEELKDNNKKMLYGNMMHLIMVFGGLTFLFAMMLWFL